MLDFCGERGIAADIELIPIQRINSAFDRLVAAELLQTQELNHGITLSVQSMDADTLKIIKRRNMKVDSLSCFTHRYKMRPAATPDPRRSRVHPLRDPSGNRQANANRRIRTQCKTRRCN